MGARTNFIIKRIIIFLVVVFILIQFFRPAKNQSDKLLSSDITNVTVVPDGVLHVLKIACYDCHSNNTRYPWYNNIQPVYLWMSNHIKDGKGKLNFSTFGEYGLVKGEKKLKGIVKEIEKDEMPLSSYTLIHRDAMLDSSQKSLLINWAKNVKLIAVNIKNP